MVGMKKDLNISLPAKAYDSADWPESQD